MNEHRCDVLVVGAGAAGLATAVAARKRGLDVLLVEKDRFYGGTTALSGGWLWVPCSPHAQRAGIADSLAAVRTYLRHECGPRYDAARIDSYLESAPEMVAFFERETQVRFTLGPTYPDYHPDVPGGTDGGRALCATPFDGRALGAHLATLRPPVPELTLFGLKVGSGPDFKHFFNARRSLRSALYVAGRIVRHATDVLRFGRDVLLMNGNALVGRLAASAFDAGVTLWLRSPVVGLDTDDRGRVTGARVRHDGADVRVVARHGVVFASGGFAQDMDRRRAVYPHAPGPEDHFSLAAPGDTGDALTLAETLGGHLDATITQPGAWMPMSRVPRRDGSHATYPHSFDRGKPGAILVDPAGQRFANEGDSYHDVVAALLAQGAASPHAYMIVDRAFIRRYGLGFARPFPLPLQRHLRSGYIAHGATLADLARAIGVPPEALQATVAAFNTHAAAGSDPQFHRGHNAYNRHQGDADRGANACVAPIDAAPFYAVKVYPGDLGTFAGLATDVDGRVLGASNAPIAGLYAVGNDMASIFGGAYPGPGANLGPALTYGYRCAQFIANAAQAGVAATT